MTTLQANLDAGKAKIRSQNEDSRRGEFLRALDVAAETLSDFEIEFVGSFLGRMGKQSPEFDFQWFTHGRRQVVDGMIHRYGMRTLQPVSGATKKLPTAPAGHCGYLVRNDETGRRECCGAKATVKTGRDLELCATHAATRAAELKHLRDAKEKHRS